MRVFVVLELVDGNEGNPGISVFANKPDAEQRFCDLIEENRSAGHDMDDDGISQYVLIVGPEELEVL